MRIDLPGAEITLLRGWLQPGRADALLAALLTGIDWEVHRIRLFGREIDSPRLSSWIGDPQAIYRYSGVRFEPRPWSAALVTLRDRLLTHTGHAFNSVLANRYRDGRDAMGWHSDDEAELGHEPLIASLSLGATRKFVVRHRRERSLQCALSLAHGDLLLMAGATQTLYQHALPRTARLIGERINLTFRWIEPAR